MSYELKMYRYRKSLNKFIILNSSFILFLSSCSVQKKIARSAKENVLSAPALQTAHVGISVYEPATNKYWFNYQGDKYFVPASNTKIPTCYAAMKYLGDSLVGLRYGIPEEKWFKENVLVILPAGDPTFLHDDYRMQPAFDFLNKSSRDKRKIGFCITNNVISRWGDGWSWNDYDASYMAERNQLPIFGNTVKITLNEVENRNASNEALISGKKLWLFRSGVGYFDSIINNIPFLQSVSRKQFKDSIQKWKLIRNIESNRFSAEKTVTPFSNQTIPFVTDGFRTALEILKDTLKKSFRLVVKEGDNKYLWDEENSDITIITISNWNKIHSQPTDSLLKPMMHRSDNFFAEQSLLMVSNEMLGYMSDEKVIDSLLKTDFKDLPQRPRWADGSGLSRYNLFTPQDFVSILLKMKDEFGMERIKTIFPTGGEGTLSSYYKPEGGYIYAKTGTLSGVVALSGFLYTKKNKLLIFSILVNNHHNAATDVRRAVEKFVQELRKKY